MQSPEIPGDHHVGRAFAGWLSVSGEAGRETAYKTIWFKVKPDGSKSAKLKNSLACTCRPSLLHKMSLLREWVSNSRVKKLTGILILLKASWSKIRQTCPSHFPARFTSETVGSEDLNTNLKCWYKINWFIYSRNETPSPSPCPLPQWSPLSSYLCLI